jgi:hypothetical protein
MNDIGHYIWLDAPVNEDGVPSWKALDSVIRKWAVLSGFEKDQNNYQKMKEMYQ